MTEERERYQWETEDGTGTAAVPDVAPFTVAALWDEFQNERRLTDDRLATLTARLDRVQDANIAPMLESSAVIVELRGIRSAIEALTKSIDGVQEANVYGQWCIRTMPFGGAS